MGVQPGSPGSTDPSSGEGRDMESASTHAGGRGGDDKPSFSRLRRRKTVGRLLAEMSVIVFSVLLALAANEWRQGAARQAAVETVLEMVYSEVTRNRAEVVRSLAHHEELLGQMRGGGVTMARLHLPTTPVDTSSVAALGESITALVQAEARSLGRRTPPPFEASRLPDGDWFLESPEGFLRVEIRGDTAVVLGSGNISLNPPFLVEAAWEAAQATQAALSMEPEVVELLARIRQLHRHVESLVARLVDILYGMSGAAEPMSALSDLITFQELLVDAYDELLERLE